VSRACQKLGSPQLGASTPRILVATGTAACSCRICHDMLRSATRSDSMPRICGLGRCLVDQRHRRRALDGCARCWSSQAFQRTGAVAPRPSIQTSGFPVWPATGSASTPVTARRRAALFPRRHSGGARTVAVFVRADVDRSALRPRGSRDVIDWRTVAGTPVDRRGAGAQRQVV
jgi:hypothetical protein